MQTVPGPQATGLQGACLQRRLPLLMLQCPVVMWPELGLVALLTLM